MSVSSHLFSVVLIVAIAGLLWLRRGGHAWTGIPLLICVVGGVVFLARSLVRAPPGRVHEERLLDREESAGWVLGDHLRSAAATGRVLVLRNPPVVGHEVELSAARCRGLLAALTNEAIDLVFAGPNRGGLGSAEPGFHLFGEHTWEADLSGWLAGQRDVRAVVCLLHEPPSRCAVPLYAFAVGYGGNWEQAIRSGRWRAAVVYKLPEDVREPVDAQSHRAVFDAGMQLVTTGNVDELMRARKAVDPTPVSGR